MRHVPRAQIPADLDGPDSPGGRETTRQIAFHQHGESGSQPAFAAYKRDAVKAALQAMFHGKCAYCESNIAGVAPPDIEHYRPKGAVIAVDGTVLPGYYWLGADWNNLLTACIDCNRAREQTIDGVMALSGKANQFPLADETQRAVAPGDEIHESPLLIDPTRERRPEDHLEFVEDGVIRPAQVQGNDSLHGTSTIDVVGLRRRGLVERRADRLCVVDATIRRFEECADDLNQAPESSELAERVARELREIRRLTAPNAEYSAMARQRVRQKLGHQFRLY